MDEKRQSKRKQLRLSGYDYSQDNTYFVTICTFNRERLFGEIVRDTVGAHLCVRHDGRHRIIEKWLEELEHKYPFLVVDEYVIMPDHLHFLLTCSGAHTGAPLPEIIKWFKTQTTNEYIKGVKSGIYPPFDRHIWQRNYYEHVIRNEQDYYETIQYMRNNPMAWWLKNSNEG